MLAQIDRATDAVVTVPGVADMFRGLRRLPDPEEAARDEARHLAVELREERRRGDGLAVRLEAAQGEARWHAWVARGYRNYLVLWICTSGVLAVGMVAEYLIMRGG